MILKSLFIHLSMYYNLRKLLEEKVGFELTTVKSFRKLEKLLYAESIAVSYSTLNRMFNPAYQVQPRIETLNLLSRYLGFSDYKHFEEERNNESIKDELYFAKELELKAYILNNDFESAVSLYQDCLQYDEKLYTGLTQVLGLALFNTPDFDIKKLEYLLTQQAAPPYFMEYFVYEDDYYGHYQKALTEIDYDNHDAGSKSVFKTLFTQRKKILSGEKIDFNEFQIQEDNYHLQSRFFELKLYHLLSRGEAVADYIMQTTHYIIRYFNESKDWYRSLFYVGRWCRALVYTHQFPLTKDIDTWPLVCLSVFYSPLDNIEFKAPVFAYLKLAEQEQLPFYFYKKNQWENAILESQLLMSLGLGNKKAAAVYSKKLNIITH